jgi:hypothetical protein
MTLIQINKWEKAVTVIVLQELSLLFKESLFPLSKARKYNLDTELKH